VPTVETPAALPVMRLKAFLDAYIVERSDVKDGTTTVYNHTRRCLIERFGADRPLDSITVSDAKSWRRWLVAPKNEENPSASGQGLAENTARRRCGIAKQFFNEAIDREIIEKNPFAKMKKLSVGSNKEREFYIDRATAERVIEACPDSEWKLIFALSRYGGLRCPSEHLALTWGDVNWDAETITVHSPKTEHHDGKGERVIPLWNELRPHLEAAYKELLVDFDPEAKKISEQPIIRRYRDSNTNLRTHFCRILKRAGVPRWPKLFHNLRATRETELIVEIKDIHAVCAWIGNSPEVALRHYAQVRAEDRQRALLHKVGHSTNQKLTQTGEGERITANEKQLPSESPYESSDIDSDCTSLRPVAFEGMGDTGLEPVTSAV
jgi:integrase